MHKRLPSQAVRPRKRQSLLGCAPALHATSGSKSPLEDTLWQASVYYEGKLATDQLAESAIRLPAVVSCTTCTAAKSLELFGSASASCVAGILKARSFHGELAAIVAGVGRAVKISEAIFFEHMLPSRDR